MNQKTKNKINAQLFGNSLDLDDFETTKSLLSDNCVYDIGSEKLKGPKGICNSYEQNMIAGRKKLDELKWGESTITEINTSEFLVHFTDYLKHKNQSYIHKCSQKLIFDSEGKISQIIHIDNEKESAALRSYYDKVGL